MKHYFITGASTGIGKALAERLLASEGVFVTGISRRQSIIHEKYKHITLDLSDTKAVTEFHFPLLSHVNEVCLVNNAGVISEIVHAGQLSESSIINDSNVNMISPFLLIHKFMEAFKEGVQKKVILSISSGASKRAVEGWSVYCSTKAALDMFSEVVALEQKSRSGFRIFSIAPGVVDTRMQEQLRKADGTQFGRLEEFLRLKEEGKLTSPIVVADKIIYILNYPEHFPDTVFSLRDVKI